LSLTIPGDWFVNPMVLGDFYNKYKNYPLKEIRKISFEQGLVFGRSVRKKLGIEDDSVGGIAAVLKEVLKDEPTAKIERMEGNKVLLRNAGFCPLMTACLSLNLPWTWLCSALGWPFFHGLASAVNPKANLIMTNRREKGDPHCDHIFEIGEGKLILP